MASHTNGSTRRGFLSVVTVGVGAAIGGAVAVPAVAGAIAPGISQLLFTRAVGEAGAARTAVVMGTAPLVSVAIALAVLDEPFRLVLVGGAALIVAGGIALAGERVRPADFRHYGIVLAIGATLLFAVRDNLLRWLAGHTDTHALLTAPVTLVAGAGTVAVYLAVTRGREWTTRGGDTNVPEPGRRYTVPRRTRSSTAWRAVIRDRPCRSAIARSDASRSWGRRPPDSMARSSSAAT